MTQPNAFIGVDYFPEHWPEDRWARDCQMMRDCGLTVARIAEFTWSKTQPRPDVWEWDWLDRAVDVIAQAGLKVILCTPTACPPPWMIERDPSILPIINGKTFGLGHRRHYSPHHEAYRAASADCARRMAERWGGHEAVIGFQIDNEICGNLNDTGPLAASAFQAWLRERHGDLATLDERLGLVFWGQQYDAWDQIPVASASNFHPGLQLEFARFSSQAWVRYCRAQADAMRPLLGDHQMLTTNCYLPYWGMVVDWYELMRDGGLDVFAIDNYARTAADGAFFNDLGRSLSEPYWILEQQCGSTAGQHIWPDRIGRIAEDTGVAVRKGAQVITFFRWRQALYGNEQQHGAIIDHHGEPGSVYEEVKDFCHSLPAVERRRQVGVAFTWDDAWMARTHTPELDYSALHAEGLAAALHALQLDARYCFTPAQASEEDVLLLPFKIGYDESWERAVLDAIASGRTVIAFPLLFAKDLWNVYRTDYCSPAIETAFGVDVRRRIPLRSREAIEAADQTVVGAAYEAAVEDYGFHGHWDGTAVRGEFFAEELAVADAEVLARFSAAPLDDEALVTCKQHPGGGRAVWCASYLDSDGLQVLLRELGIG